MMRQGYDFAVIGGGLVGSAIARGLALEDRSVIVLDEGDRAFRAARANFALIWAQMKGANMVRYANWTRQSVDLWPQFAKDIETDSGLTLSLQQPGGFHLALSDREFAQLGSLARAINEQPGVVGYPYELLDGAEIRRRLPGVGPNVVGGSYSPIDGHVNALRLFHGFHRAMIRRGVEYRADHRIERIESGDGFRLFGKFAGAIYAKGVVLAAGLDNARLAPMLGLDAPVRPQRGQIVVTERTQSFLRYPLSMLRQTDEGSLLIGDSHEEDGMADSIGCGVASVMAARAVQMFPRIAALNVLRYWDCWRVLSPDGSPIYDESARYPGAFLATCHSGVTLAAVHGTILASSIARGSVKNEFSAFSARRFHVSTDV